MRALAFGDLESEVWGVIWLPGDEPAGVLALRAGPTSSRLDVTLGAGATQDPWSLEGDGISLEFLPTAEGRHGSDAELRTEAQLCQVTGRARVEASELEVRCLGWRSTVGDAAELGKVESFRLLAGWLEPAFGFSVLALRPGRARGQDADAVAAVMLEDPASRPVVDPRLSTTYSDAGLPRRAGLELWLEEYEEDEDTPDDDGSAQYPRRAAGDAVGAGLDWSQGEFELHASLLRWHSHGREGPGVYVLGRRR